MSQALQARAPPCQSPRSSLTHPAGVIKRYPNGSDFKMELTFRLNRNGVASLDSAEVMLEDRVEFEKCEIVKPPPAPKVNVTTTSNATKKEKSDSTPPTETDDNASKEQPKDDDSKTKGDEEGKKPEDSNEQSKKPEDSNEQSDSSSDQGQEPKTDAPADEQQVNCVIRCRHRRTPVHLF